jgi:hypothetical protein
MTAPGTRVFLGTFLSNEHAILRLELGRCLFAILTPLNDTPPILQI